ncbi:MAG: hypothetical protein QXW56_05960 [Nitrososphaerota archaeon]
MRASGLVPLVIGLALVAGLVTGMAYGSIRVSETLTLSLTSFRTLETTLTETTEMTRFEEVRTWVTYTVERYAINLTTTTVTVLSTTSVTDYRWHAYVFPIYPEGGVTYAEGCFSGSGPPSDRCDRPGEVRTVRIELRVEVEREVIVDVAGIVANIYRRESFVPARDHRPLEILILEGWNGSRVLARAVLEGGGYRFLAGSERMSFGRGARLTLVLQVEYRWEDVPYLDVVVKIPYSYPSRTLRATHSAWTCTARYCPP